MKPSRDPSKPIEGRTWYGKRWMTPEQIKRTRERARRWDEANKECKRRYYEANRERILEQRHSPEGRLRGRMHMRKKATEREREFVLKWLEKHPDLKEVAVQYGFAP